MILLGYHFYRDRENMSKLISFYQYCPFLSQSLKRDKKGTKEKG